MMDLVTQFPWTPQRHDAVWVIVDWLTKSTHFLAVRMTFTLEEFYWLYIRGIIQVHGVPVFIVSDRDPRLWHTLEEFPEGHGDAMDDKNRFFIHRLMVSRRGPYKF